MVITDRERKCSRTRDTAEKWCEICSGTSQSEVDAKSCLDGSRSLHERGGGNVSKLGSERRGRGKYAKLCSENSELCWYGSESLHRWKGVFID
jgi:hypothetical protein